MTSGTGQLSVIDRYNGRLFSAGNQDGNYGTYPYYSGEKSL